MLTAPCPASWRSGSCSIRTALFALSLFPLMPVSSAADLEEAVRYVGSLQPDPLWHHGGVPPAVGVHRYQALRANRTRPPEGGEAGWTYNHAPMLAYWQGRFWLEYVTNLVEEHHVPGRTGMLSSADGRNWTNPKVAFPVISLPEINPPPRYFNGEHLPVVPAGTASIMHQRMGWYVAPSGRLLMLGFYSYCPSIRWGPNRGQGLGRVVREISADGSVGPIYFLRYNRDAGWNEKNTSFPFYSSSTDAGFVAACNALLADKLMTLQWWEEDRATDGFFTLPLPPGTEPKALSYYRRADGVTVGLWKSGVAALSPDGGRSWTPARHSLPEAAAKVWGQHTEDGRYALVYDHSATRRNRYPLVIVTGDDGRDFDNMLLVHGDVPPMRYRGVNKNIGPQYIRGIVPGNGNPPGDHLWITYSMNKEDLWVTRVRVPVTGKADRHAAEDFEAARNESDLERWNLYVPKWAPISVVSDPLQSSNRCLELRDEEPYDHAVAELVFPGSQRVRVSFRLAQLERGLNGLEIEAQTARGARPLRLWFDREEIGFDQGGTEEPRTPFDLGRWHDFTLNIDCGAGRYDVAIDGRPIAAAIPLDGKPASVERLVFRTGPWKMDVRPFVLKGEPAAPGVYDADLPGADQKSPPGVYLLDDVKTAPL